MHQRLSVEHKQRKLKTSFNLVDFSKSTQYILIISNREEVNN